jgi:hypothetical protein
LLLSLGLVGGALSACGGKDQGQSQIPQLGCGNAPACSPGCPPPDGVVCHDGGIEYDASSPADAHETIDASKTVDAPIDGPEDGFSFGCGNAVLCAPGCPAPPWVTCTDAGPVYDGSTSD